MVSVNCIYLMSVLIVLTLAPMYITTQTKHPFITSSEFSLLKFSREPRKNFHENSVKKSCFDDYRETAITFTHLST